MVLQPKKNFTPNSDDSISLQYNRQMVHYSGAVVDGKLE